MTTTTQTPPIQFSPSAIRELLRLQKNETDKPYLRVGVKGGGCSGMTYLIEWTDDKKADDKELSVEGLHVLLNPAHLLYIHDILVDYESGLNARGFTFTNPNAKETCGCGTSFSV